MCYINMGQYQKLAYLAVTKNTKINFHSQVIAQLVNLMALRCYQNAIVPANAQRLCSKGVASFAGRKLGSIRFGRSKMDVLST